MKQIKSISVIVKIFTIAYLFTINVYAQRPADKMYSKTLVRAIDLREKQNSGIFSKNREITKWIVEAVVKGELKPYSNDSLLSTLSLNDFHTNLTVPVSGTVVNLNNPQDTLDAFLNFGSDWRQLVNFREEFFHRDLYQLEIKEEIVFDKNISKIVYVIKALTLFIPADHPSNVKGIQIPVASFSYDEIKENVFSNPNAIWYNSQNESAHLNLADAFDLRLFSSYIIKVGNDADKMLADIYNDDKTGRYASEWAGAEQMEYEHHLWEF